MRNTFQLLPHIGLQAGQPFFFHHQRFDLGFAQSEVVVIGLTVEFHLQRFDGFLQRGFADAELLPLLEHGAFISTVGIITNFGETVFDLRSVDLVETC
ncbi:hypothetical protein D3C72_1642220 [compost metagenome]